MERLVSECLDDITRYLRNEKPEGTTPVRLYATLMNRARDNRRPETSLAYVTGTSNYITRREAYMLAMRLLTSTGQVVTGRDAVVQWHTHAAQEVAV